MTLPYLLALGLLATPSPSSAGILDAEINVTGFEGLADTFALPGVGPEAFNPAVIDALHQRIVAVAEREGYALEPGAPEKLRVDVSMGEFMMFDLAIVPIDHGNTLPTIARECRKCVPNDVFDTFEAMLPEAFAALAASSSPTASPAETSPPSPRLLLPASPPPPAETPPLSPPPPSSKPRRLHALGGTGIGLLAAGAASTVLGAVFLARRETIDASDRTNFQGTRTFFVEGGITLGLGVSALVTGAVLLGIDLHRHPRRRPALDAHRMLQLTQGRF